MAAKSPSSSDILWFWVEDLEKAQKKTIEQMIKLLEIGLRGKGKKKKNFFLNSLGKSEDVSQLQYSKIKVFFSPGIEN